MQAKSLIAISISTTALLGAIPANSQPFAVDTEAELIGLRQSCDHGDRQACIRFGFILGEDQERQAEWRQSHPDWWAWEGAANAQVASVTIAPPELPSYEQPPIPAPGYMWTPGYWAYGQEGYFWVPGTWVLPPTVGMLWTPGYWGWREGIYVWSAGYWGPHIGFYGGVNYGFGYGGIGYGGGHWNNGVFAYNQTVNNFGGVRVTNVYSETVVVRSNVRVSFNGGSGGTQAQPTPQEEATAHEQHVPATAEQTHQQQMASTNKALLASENQGHPAIAATAKPGEFSGKGVVAAREATLGSARPGEPPTGTRMPETNPIGAKTMETNPTGARKPETNPTAARTLETNPTEARKPESNPTGANKLDKKGLEGERATLNGGTPPKPSNTEAKPLSATPPPQPTKPNSPQPPHLATAPQPHPVVVPHPPAKPGPTPKDKKTPG
jgi:WXXGXW repeat (2 copies)